MAAGARRGERGVRVADGRGPHGAWRLGGLLLVLAAAPASPAPADCTVTRDPAERSWDRPFVLRTDSAAFRARTRVDALRASHGAAIITLSSANTFSYGRASATVAAHLDALADPAVGARWAASDGVGLRADSLFYWFGEHAAEWAPLLAAYDYAPLLAALPPAAAAAAAAAARAPALSLGAGAHLSGVPFHQHGAGFSESLHGAKRWLFSGDAPPPRFLPNATAAYWLREVLPTLSAAERARVCECVVFAGEAVFFPAGHYHATVNEPGPGEVAVFVSTFL
jgi:hypothetical protein